MKRIMLGGLPRMDTDLEKLVVQYQQTDDLDERLRLADAIIYEVGPTIKAHIAKLLPDPATAESVFLKTLEGIVKSLRRFNRKASFVSWCYKIARNKFLDQLRHDYADRFHPTDPDELQQLIDSRSAASGMSPGDKLDYEFLISLLNKSKPDCYDFLYKRHILGWEYKLIGESRGLAEPTAKMRTNRCLEHAQELASDTK
ncbi:MAG TPA: sigma-70 family RNA polymerase sigma factor [Verrucomicrobiae bacterium]|nr:sigma-70 family RNA polymerase sigma factor [Verrucomicrobiae bacterium]